MKWDAIVLAAGQGTRMKSKTPKVLHLVGDLPMIERTIKALKSAGSQNIHIVISEDIKLKILYLNEKYENVFFHIQKEALGTADAVLSVKTKLSEKVLICNGDHPLMNSKDIKDFISDLSEFKLSVAYVKLKSPGSFGRIVLNDQGQIKSIVEAKDCNPEQFKIQNVNTGIYFGSSDQIFSCLNELSLQNRDSEFYLTDIVEKSLEQSIKVHCFKTTEEMAFGVNDPVALYQANEKAHFQKNLSLLASGVRFLNPKATYIGEDVEIEPDVYLEANVYIYGKTKIGSGSTIESGVHIKDSLIGPNTIIKSGSYLEQVTVHGESSIGPYARLREGTLVEKHVKLGNFVETKKTTLKQGAKAGHQCYLGDTEVGENTNIGAGTITCNFAVDEKKYRTIIGKDVFIGSDTQIIAPVEIHDNAVVAAGSTVTKNVEANSLYVTRAKSVVKKNYR